MWKSLGELPWKSGILFHLSVFFGLLWLAPITFLLYMNFNGFVIGPELGCAWGYCSANSYSAPTGNSETAQHFQDTSRDALGALQIVAKTLEVFFVYNACSFSWIIMKLMLASRAGLPTGHLLRHIEFTDPLTILNPAFWAPLIPSQKQDRTGYNKSGTRGIFSFTLLTFVVAALANLMGPATAVLTLPTIKWKDAARSPTQRFIGSFSDKLPGEVDTGCSATELRERDYRCTRQTYGVALDSSIEAYITQQNSNASKITCGPSAGKFRVLVSEDGLAFSYNTTVGKRDSTSWADRQRAEISWAPSRQVVRDLAKDARSFSRISCRNGTNSQYAKYQSSIQLNLENKGSITGFRSYYTWRRLSRTIINDSQEIRCYISPYPNENISDYSSSGGSAHIPFCFRVGTDWNDDNSSDASFHIGYEVPASNAVDANIYYVNNSVGFF